MTAKITDNGATSAPHIAAPPAPRGAVAHEIFSRLDANNDGAIGQFEHDIFLESLPAFRQSGAAPSPPAGLVSQLFAEAEVSVDPSLRPEAPDTLAPSVLEVLADAYDAKGAPRKFALLPAPTFTAQG